MPAEHVSLGCAMEGWQQFIVRDHNGRIFVTAFVDERYVQRLGMNLELWAAGARPDEVSPTPEETLPGRD